MNNDATNPFELDDDEFDTLEQLLTSDAVPEDCMNLEMLDGYLAGLIASPVVIGSAQWMPAVWTAHGDEIEIPSGNRMQRVIALVIGYYNELVSTIGARDGWEPFWYAGSDGEGMQVGEEWIEGFIQGLELWPEDWASGVPEDDADTVRSTLDALIAPWQQSTVSRVDEEVRLEWLEDARSAVCSIVSRWRTLGLPTPQPLLVGESSARRSSVAGRNDPCPCGSGKKYKKCCGAG